MIETAVVIANWNGKKYLKDCLDSLRDQTYRDFQIFFVDNGSADGSVGFVRENYPEVRIKQISRNVGFAAGYNLGIRQALKDKKINWVVALNNDTKLQPSFIEEIVSCARRHPDAGSIQSKVLNFFEDQKIDCAGIVIAKDGTAHNRGYGESDSDQYDRETEIFGANATAVLYARKALEEIRMPQGDFFDRDFFAYYEDVDLAWRLRLAGFAAYFCPQARVFHVHSATTGKFSLFKAYYLHRNYFLTVFKNYPFGIMMKVLAWRLWSYGRLVFSIFQKGKHASEYAEGQGKGRVALVILKAGASVIFNLPGIIGKRWTIQKRKKIRQGEIKKWLQLYGAKF